MSNNKKSVKGPHPVSIEGDLWQKYLEKSRSEGMSLSFVIRRLLDSWYKGSINLDLS